MAVTSGHNKANALQREVAPRTVDIWCFRFLQGVRIRTVACNIPSLREGVVENLVTRYPSFEAIMKQQGRMQIYVS